MMTNEEQLRTDKEEFIELIKSIKRDGFDCERLLRQLEHSDFYTAPASTKYHNSFEGGLLSHSLNVYYNLMHLVTYKYDMLRDKIDENSIKIVALLHDMSKMNYYEKTVTNKKVYSENGSKYDLAGKFDWVAVPSYKVREASDRLVFGSHENTSEYMIRQFIPLTLEESVAIQHHHGTLSWDSAKDNIGEIYDKYSLALLLHLADYLAASIDEQVG